MIGAGSAALATVAVTERYVITISTVRATIPISSSAAAIIVLMGENRRLPSRFSICIALPTTCLRDEVSHIGGHNNDHHNNEQQHQGASNNPNPAHQYRVA